MGGGGRLPSSLCSSWWRSERKGIALRTPRRETARGFPEGLRSNAFPLTRCKKKGIQRELKTLLCPRLFARCERGQRPFQYETQSINPVWERILRGKGGKERFVPLLFPLSLLSLHSLAAKSKRGSCSPAHRLKRRGRGKRALDGLLPLPWELGG